MNQKNIKLVLFDNINKESKLDLIVNSFKKNLNGNIFKLKIISNETINSKILQKITNDISNNKNITIKGNLNQKKINMEIKNSDIGIYLSDILDNNYISKYNFYKLPVIFSEDFLRPMLLVKLFYLKQKNIVLNDFLYSIHTIKKNYNSGVKYIPYVLCSGFPYCLSGYATRSHNIFKTFNSMYNDKKYIGLHRFGYPHDGLSNHNKDKIKSLVNKIDNVFYLTFPNVSKELFQIFFDIITIFFRVKTYQVASDWRNAKPIIQYCNINKLKSIYEIRGMWHITYVSKEIYFKMPQNKRHFFTCQIGEKWCIENCSTPLFITPQLQDFAMSVQKNKNIPPLRCNIKKTPIFWNAFNIQNINTSKKKDNGKFIIGYMGSTSFYEGILNIINVIENINNDKDILVDVEFHLVGDISKAIKEYQMYKNTDISKIFKSKFIKLYGKVPHNKAIKIISTFDLYVIPRLDLPVTNMVSPIKPYEPMSLKIPLLMSDCDALKDISENGKNCMIFRKNNNKDFYNKLKKIILNGYSKEILNNAYEFVKNERNWRNIIEKIDLYNII